MKDVHYLNVDLEIDSRVDLTPMVEHFGDDVAILFSGRWGTHYRAAFEVPSGAGANEDIQYFCTLIESLSGRAKELWNGSFSRVFDIGFESGNTAPNYRIVLQPSILTRVAASRATLAITIYPIERK